MRSLAVALVAVLAFTAGCGDGDDPKTSSDPAAPSGATATAGATVTGPTGPAQEAGTQPAKPTSPGEKDRRPPGRDQPETTTTRPEQTSPKTGDPTTGTGGTRDSRRVERYLRKNFSGGAQSGWYEHVQAISVSGATTTIETELSDDRAGRRLAKQACLDVRGTIPGITDVVRVTGAGKGALARCVP